MCGHIYGPCCGKLHDNSILNESRVPSILNIIQQDNNVRFKVYTDRGYVSTTNIVAAYKANRGMDLHQIFHLENKCMSRLRLCGTEHIFGNVTNIWNANCFVRKQKISFAGLSRC